jgi:hypothetical protein
VFSGIAPSESVVSLIWVKLGELNVQSPMEKVEGTAPTAMESKVAPVPVPTPSVRTIDAKRNASLSIW